MNTKGLGGKVQTVLGPIDADDLGITLPHEHLYTVLPTAHMQKPAGANEQLLAHQLVSMDNLGWVRYHPMASIDNQAVLSEELAISEALRYRYAGGNSIVEMSNIGLGRDPSALARLSRATGLNIVMGAGFYLASTMPPELKLDEESMTDQIVRDITVGVDNTGIRAGIIGEVGLEWPIGHFERTSLRATARAQKQTGAPVNLHLGNSPDCAFEAVQELEKAGADITRVAMSHVDCRIFDHNVRVALAKTGCYLEYDNFSFEGWYWRRMVLSESNPVKCDMPNDAERINQIMALIDEGFLNQILISHDLPQKHRLWHYGGSGYAHILENVVPLMREKGMTEEQTRTILVENPKRLLQFV